LDKRLTKTIKRIWLTINARWFNNDVCRIDETLLARLDQAILEIIDNPNQAQKTTAIGTVFS
jgi:hypothetical protein